VEGLGRLYDIVAGVAPVDGQSAQTGNRVHLKNAAGVTIVVFKGAGTAGDDFSYDLVQHTAASGGTTADLDVIDHYYLKNEATLDGDETWSKLTQSAASEITEAGGAGTSAEAQQIIVIEVDAVELSDGYEWVSLNTGGEGSNAQLISVLYLLRDLAVQRAPANLVNPQA
jgi:D-alanyl-D-alanine carboxypeptidase